jgi:hypothetical protein
MQNSPNQPPPGKQYELRVAAFDLELDKRLAAFTNPATQQKLPGYLHLFSQKKFNLEINDRDIDGHSFIETRFRGFGMQVTNHNRQKHGLELDAGLIEQPDGNGLIITAQLQLGMQAAKEIMIPPFFSTDEKDSQLIPLYYVVPDAIPREARPEAMQQLQSFLIDAHGSTIDELMLVERAVKFRSMRVRSRMTSAEDQSEQQVAS